MVSTETTAQPAKEGTQPYQPVITGWDKDGTWFVDVPTFEGPFDLLLQLVARHEVDVTLIALAKVVDEFLAVVHTLALDTTTEFLIVAATLVELKAARLLPDQGEEEVDDIGIRARDLLYARLLEYRMVRDAAVYLGERIHLGEQQLPRVVTLEAPFRPIQPPMAYTFTLASLGRMAYQLGEGQADAIDTTHIRPPVMRVHEAAQIILDWLNHGATRWATILADCGNRAEAVAHFLAVLELYKAEWLTLTLDEDGVTLTPTPEGTGRPLPQDDYDQPA